jgi:hypothetical protein
MIVEAVYEPANHLCPVDPLKTEPVFKGSRVSIYDEARYTDFVATKYCDFPVQAGTDAWAIDRTVDYYYDDPTQFCHDFNYHLRYGSRGFVEGSCNVDLTVPRNQECLKLYQSFACTIACPEYGKPARFNRICYEDAKRLWDVCDTPANYGTLYQCLSNIGYFPYDTAPIGDKDCTPLSPSELIPASGQFEHDYCFFGSRDRCDRVQDCEISLVTDWGYLGNHCPICVEYYGWSNDAAALQHIQSGPIPNGGHVCVDYFPGTDQFDSYEIFKIDKLPLNGGRSCTDSVLAYMAFNLGFTYGGNMRCYEDLRLCDIFSLNNRYNTPTDQFPTWCDSSADVDFSKFNDEIFALVQ